MTGHDLEREEALRKHFESHVKQLEQKLSLQDQQTLEIHSKLTKELEERVGERDATLKKKKEIEELLRATKEDLDLTRNSYETHLKLLSEELIQQQEKITTAEK